MRVLLFVFPLALLHLSCDTVNQAMEVLTTTTGQLTEAEISGGLKEALDQGITKGAEVLSREGGYFNSPYKILLPPEARKVTDRLQNVPGFSQVEDIILEKVNQGAEDAAKKAAPIFKEAITSMTFADAANILMGPDTAATAYLRGATYDKLFQEFEPVIIESLDKFKAREYWASAVNAYNKIPLLEDANPDLEDYVTRQALKGLFSMVQKEEVKIRRNVSARTTDLMRKVFARQDN